MPTGLRRRGNAAGSTPEATKTKVVDETVSSQPDIAKSSKRKQGGAEEIRDAKPNEPQVADNANDQRSSPENASKASQKKASSASKSAAQSSQSDVSKFSLSYLMPVLVIGLLVAARIYASSTVSTYQLAIYPRSFGTHTIVGPIERVAWDPKRNVSAELIKGGRPKVLTNTFATNWAALKLWDVNGEYLSKFMPKHLINVYRNKHHYFGPLFRPNKPLTRLKGVEWENPHEMISMPTDAFFAQVNGRATNTNGTYLYYTGDLSAPTLAKDLEPWRDLLPRLEQQRVNVWVSQRGVTAHLHVDSYENFFVQVQGRKRMLLFPPASSVNAPLYSFLHPCYGQAQPYIQAVPPEGINTPMAPTSLSQNSESLLDKIKRTLRMIFAGVFAPEAHDTARRLTRGTGSGVPEGLGGDPVSKRTGRTRESELAKFSELPGLVGYEAILEPGDMMYIPPNWFHHVEALDPAISVNFWSASWAQTYYDKAIRFAVSSLIHDWTHPQKRSAAAYLARVVIEGCKEGMDFGPEEDASLVTRFFKRHIFPRFTDMLKRGQISAAPLFPDKCAISDDLMLPNAKPDDYTDIARLLGAIGPDETLPPELPTNQKLLRSLKSVGEKIVAQFNLIQASERPIWLGNFFESIGYWTGDVDASHLYGSLSCIAYADTENLHKGATYEFKPSR